MPLKKKKAVKKPAALPRLEPGLAVEAWPIDRPVPFAGNARKLSDRAVATVALSLKEYGWRQPIVVDGADVIVAGHTRLLAARSLGMLTVPVHVALDLTAVQIAGYRLMDNRAADETEWDAELLGPELLRLHNAGADLALTGFTKEELKSLLKAAGLAAYHCDEDEIPEPPAAPVSVAGDLWMLGRHRLLCGDSTAADATARLFAGVLPDLCFTDPPYGVAIVKRKGRKTPGRLTHGKVGSGGKLRFGRVGDTHLVPATTFAVIAGDGDTNAARAFYECAKGAGVKNFIVWGGNYFTDFLPPSRCWLIWDKQNSGDFADVELAWTAITKAAPRDVEMGWSSLDKTARLYPYLWNGLARAGDRKSELVSRVHPTQKPVGLFERIFEDFPFEVCYDAFLGSGSTLIACEKLGRTCLGMELAREYIDVVVNRWQNFTGAAATLEADGRTFEDVKRARLQQ